MGFQKIATGNNFVIGILDGLVTVFGPNQIVKNDLTLIQDAVDVFAADDIAFAIHADGNVTGFGSTRNERLPILTPVENAKQIAIGPDFVLCLQQDGTLKKWGSGTAPIPPDILASTIVSISNSLYDITAVCDDGRLIQWNLKQ